MAALPQLRRSAKKNRIGMSRPYIFIYGTERLPCALDEIEDEFQDRLQPFAEVTGTGTGESGWNIDLELETTEPINHVLHKITEVIAAILPLSDCSKVELDICGTRTSFDQLRDSLK
jgi:hypothetical protein